MSSEPVCSRAKKEADGCGGTMRPSRVQTLLLPETGARDDFRVVQRRLGLRENSFDELLSPATVARENV